jgi:uncharacterized protein (DUF885 family)
MKTVLAVTILILSLPLIDLSANELDDQFEKIAKDYIDGYLSSHPESATQLGDHRFDGSLTDYSPSNRDRLLAREKQFLVELQKFDDPSKLTGPNQVDVRILRENVEAQIFELEELKEPDWNPLVYNESLANSLYLLVARDFDSAEKRIPNLRARMEAIPHCIEQAKQNLQHSPKVYTETAIEQIHGAVALVREGLGPLLEQAPQMKKDLAQLQDSTLPSRPICRWKKS